MDCEDGSDQNSNGGSSHSSFSALADDSHESTVRGSYRFLGLTVPVTVKAFIPPEFDPQGVVLTALQTEHHEFLTDLGCASAGTIITSVRTPLSKAAHVLQTTLVDTHSDHFEHLVWSAVKTWAESKQNDLVPVGPSFAHHQYGAVVGRSGQTIRSLSPAAKLLWDASDPLAGQYVICVPECTDAHAGWCQQLHARLQNGPPMHVGLASNHPFTPSARHFELLTSCIPQSGIVIFDVEVHCADPALLQGLLQRTFDQHTKNLLKAAPRFHRSCWLLEVDAKAKIFPAFESTVLAAEYNHGCITVALARRHWQQCKETLLANLREENFI